MHTYVQAGKKGGRERQRQIEFVHTTFVLEPLKSRKGQQIPWVWS